MGFKVVDLEARNIIKSGSSDSYLLLGGGGTKAVSDFATSGHTHSYLPLSGGTLTSSEAGPLKINSTQGSNSYVQFQSSGTAKSEVGWTTAWGTYLYDYPSGASLRISSSGVLNFNGNTILNASNYSSYAVPLSGGAMTGPLNLAGAGDWPLHLNNSGSGHIGITYGAQSLYIKNIQSDGTIISNNIELYLGSNEYRVLNTGNYTTYCATSDHNHDGRYIKSSGGGTITGGNLIIDKNDGCYIINNSALTESIAFGNTSSSSGSSFGYVYSVNNSTGSGFNYLTFRDHKIGVCNRVSPQYNLDVNGSVNGTTIYENGTLLSEKYFPHSAGYYHPLTSYLRISNGEDSKIVLDNTDNETYYQFIEFKQNDTRYGVLGTFGDTNLKWGSNIILHASNYSSYALPLSGGAMSNTNLVTNLNADKLDGYDANTIGTAGIIAVNRGGQFGYFHLYTKIGSLPTISGTGSGESYVIFHIYNAIDFGRNDPSEWIVTASSRNTYNVQARKIIGGDQLTVGYVINDDRMEIWVCFDGWYMGQTSFKVESSENFINSFSQTQTAPTGFVAGTKTYLLDGSTLTNTEIDNIIT